MSVKKYRIYLRITKNGKVAVSLKPRFDSLYSGSYHKIYLPTLQIALDLSIDENEFESTRILLEKKIEFPQSAIEIKEENLIKNLELGEVKNEN